MADEEELTSMPGEIQAQTMTRDEAIALLRRSDKGERMVGQRIDCLDHGFVELLDYMGDDKAIEEAARVSFTGGEEEERTPEQTNGLIRYLMRHRHTTPFEMVEFKLRIACPLFVWQQWLRHRTASINQLSSRYAAMPDLFYLPKPERVRLQSSSNKQGSADEVMQDAEREVAMFAAEQREARELYEARLESGMAKEVARINLPTSQYTVAIWKIDLHNLMHFLSLRLHEHAQEEIRVFSEAIADVVYQICPLAFKAFRDYRLDALTFSAGELVALRQLVLGEGIDLDQLGLSSREQVELQSKLRKMGLDVQVIDIAEV